LERVIHRVSSYTTLAVLPVAVPERIVALENYLTEEKPDVPAYIIRGPDDCSVLIGGTVTLDVLFSGFPEPSVKWLKAVS